MTPYLLKWALQKSAPSRGSTKDHNGYRKNRRYLSPFVKDSRSIVVHSGRRDSKLSERVLSRLARSSPLHRVLHVAHEHEVNA